MTPCAYENQQTARVDSAHLPGGDAGRCLRGPRRRQGPAQVRLLAPQRHRRSFPIRSPCSICHTCRGPTANLPPDGQAQDSPVSKFGLAKAALRHIVQQNSNRFNFGLSWYSYHQESISKNHWSYQFTSNTTIAGATFDYPGDAFQSAVGTYYGVRHRRLRPDPDSGHHGRRGDLRHHRHDHHASLVGGQARGRDGHLHERDCRVRELRRICFRKHHRGSRESSRRRASGTGQRRPALRAAHHHDRQGVPDEVGK